MNRARISGFLMALVLCLITAAVARAQSNVFTANGAFAEAGFR